MDLLHILISVRSRIMIGIWKKNKKSNHNNIKNSNKVYAYDRPRYYDLNRWSAQLVKTIRAMLWLNRGAYEN